MLTTIKDQLFSQINAAQGIHRNMVRRATGDKYIWSIVVLLAITSLLVVYSATSSLAYKYYDGNNTMYLFKQLAFIVVGIFVIYFMHRVNYTIYSRVSLWLYLISIPLLIYTLFFGVEVNDASRWIKLPVLNLTIQTSDLARLALFMYISRQLSRKQNDIKDFKKGFLPLIIPTAIVCVLILPANLSTALLTGMTSLLLMFIGRVSVKHILLLLGIAAIPVMLIVAVAVSTYNGNSKDDDSATSKHKVASTLNSMGRFGTWVQRTQDFIYAKDEDIPYQVQQQNIAIANGGILFGLGPGNSKQKNYLPQAYNDSIYPIIIEEYGLFGGLFIIFLYLVFLFRCIRLFRKCPYAFGAFLALGLSFTLVIQAVANMAVGVNLIPVTGVTLPLVSMGGSSFLFTCASIGIILSVARNIERLEDVNNPEPKVAVVEVDDAKNQTKEKQA
ncbi:MAG TPA: FtsW/RodA/SpoVE family cell cycle protein [Parafilimonas sp.]|nr:FtsW/RodA/SpoVE family cell cycle protein [Parafilimonas sp.]